MYQYSWTHQLSRIHTCRTRRRRLHFERSHLIRYHRLWIIMASPMSSHKCKALGPALLRAGSTTSSRTCAMQASRTISESSRAFHQSCRTNFKMGSRGHLLLVAVAVLILSTLCPAASAWSLFSSSKPASAPPPLPLDGAVADFSIDGGGAGRDPRGLKLLEDAADLLNY